MLGSWGWGAALVTAAVRTRVASRQQARLEVPLQILLGVALFLAVGGVLVAADTGRFDVLVAWHVLGVVLLLGHGRRQVANLGARLRSLTAWQAAGAALGVALGALLVLVSLGIAIGVPYYNRNDDDAGYIYLARRLLDTGGLIDPFSTRRLTAYGGSTLYQSLFLNVSGNSAVRGFEWTFAALLLALVAVRTLQRRWWALGAFVVGAGVLVGAGSGPLQNLSPVFSAAALSLGAYQLLCRLRSATDDDDRFVAACVGLLLGGVLALRFYFLVPVALAAVAVILVAGRRPWRTLAWCAGTAVASSVGWALAMDRSSGSPLFPLVSGNDNPGFPVGPNPLRAGVHTYLSRLWAAVEGYHVGLVAAAAVVVGAALLGARRRRPVTAVVLVAAGLGCLAQLALYSVALSGFAPLEIDRFAAPSSLACGLLVIDALWPRRAPDAPSLRAELRRLLAPGAPVPWTRLAPGAVAGAALVASVLLVFDVPPGRAGSSVVSDTRRAVHVLAGTTGFADRYAALRGEYRELNAAIPAGAKVLAAVDQPSLLDVSKFSFATLDVAGSVSPPPHMPFFTGTEAKLRYLRAQGFGYIAVSASSDLGLYQVVTWQHDLRSANYNYRAWAPYFIDWSAFVTALERHRASTVNAVGSLAVIDIAPH